MPSLVAVHDNPDLLKLVRFFGKARPVLARCCSIEALGAEA
jgi:hypothetical protein